MMLDLATILMGSIIVLLMMLFVTIGLYLKKYSEVTQQKREAEIQSIHQEAKLQQTIPIQQDIAIEAERITEELVGKGLLGQEIAQIGFQMSMHGQFIYIVKGMEELKKKRKKK